MNEKPESARPTAAARTDTANAAPVDDAPDAIGPSDSGQRPGGQVDGGSAGDRVAMNFDDDEVYSGTGNNARRGGTTHAKGGDSGAVEAPTEQLSRSNEPRERNF